MVQANLRKRLDKIRAMPVLLPKNHRHQYDVTDLKKGSHFLFRKHAYVVIDVHRFEETWQGQTWKWYELEVYNLNTGATSYVEWIKDDVVEVSFTPSNQSLKLRDIGIDDDKLDEISQDEEGSVKYQGKRFDLHEDGKIQAKYYRSNGDQGERVILFSFLNGDEFVSVNRWFADDGRTHQVFVGHMIDPDAIEVLSI